MLFSTRGTFENRLHGPSLNPTKAINWLYMTAAILKYCENNIRKILCDSEKITFEEVLNFYKEHHPESKDAAFLSDYLVAYYKDRCALFAADLEKKDIVSNWDIIDDQKYDFVLDGRKLF